MGIGVGVSRAALDVATTVAAQVPHLFFFGRDRSISGTAPLTREETAVHVQVLAVLPVSDVFAVSVFGGPTFFTVTQDLVSDVAFTHSYPYDTAAFSAATTVTTQELKIGFNVGDDVTYYFSTHVGVGWLTRYSGATIELPSANDGTVSITAGGLRLRF